MNRTVLKLVGLIIVLVLALGVVVVGAGAAYVAREVGARLPLKDVLAQVRPGADQAEAAPPEADAAQTDEDTEDAGILIAAVAADSPAAQAGLRRGDILLKVNDVAVNSLADLSKALEELNPGDAVTLTIRRGDAEQTLTATLGDRDGKAYLGITGCGEGFGFHKRIVIGGARGALITRVVADSPAAQAGLQAGDFITAVDGADVDADHSLADLIGAHQPGDTVTLTVTRPGEEQEREVTVTLGDQDGKAYLGVEYMPFAPRARRFRGDVEEFPFFIRPFSGTLPFEKFVPALPGITLPEGVERGIVVGGVDEDGPAAQAGLKKGDVITALDGEPIESLSAFRDAIAAHRPGDVVTLTVYRPREEQTQDIQVTLAGRPDDPDRAYLGLTHFGVYFKYKAGEGESGEQFEFPFPFFRRPVREVPLIPDNEV